MALGERTRVGLAWLVAIGVNLVQMVALPLFAEGAASPLEDGLDVATSVVLFGLLGWHWAFLPAFAAELVPLANLAPTWTAAVFIATRNRAQAAPSPDVSVPPMRERYRRSQPTWSLASAQPEKTISS